MTRFSILTSVAMILALSAAGAQQSPRADTALRNQARAALPSGCGPLRITATPTDSQRRAARDLAQRGQQAAILGDRVSARSQLRDAAALDPTDPDLAYQLARAHESAGASGDATAEYCRFLSLAPDAPESAEVRERVAVLTAEAQQSPTPPARAGAGAAPALPPLSPQRALSLGLAIPGGGQFYAGRPVRGMITVAGAVGALAWGMSQQFGFREVEQTALDPFGNPYTFTAFEETTSRPRLGQGIAVAAALVVASAIDAFQFAKRTQEQGLVLEVVPSGSSLAIRFTRR
jgi:hypothetical protein